MFTAGSNNISFLLFFGRSIPANCKIGLCPLLQKVESELLFYITQHLLPIPETQKELRSPIIKIVGHYDSTPQVIGKCCHIDDASCLLQKLKAKPL